jgi:cytochrome c-type biogenesis protein
MFTQTVTYSAAFLAGLLSFLSPCVLPLIPAYFSFITGFSLDELIKADRSEIRAKVFLSTMAFVLGFSLIFILMGASATLLGGVVSAYNTEIRIIGGIIIILLGVHLTGWVRIRKLEFEKRFHFKKKPIHLFGTFIVGMAFAAGWSPCIGPLLGAILVLASSEETVWQGIWLLAVYSAGLAIPFVLISIFIHFLLAFLKRASRVIRYVNGVAGGLLIIVGILMLTGNFIDINSLMETAH